MKKGKYLLVSLAVVVLTLFSLSSILALPNNSRAANGSFNILTIDITTPGHGDEIPYCTNFTVSADITAPGCAQNNVTSWITFTGNASLVSGDTDETPEQYDHGFV